MNDIPELLGLKYDIWIIYFKSNSWILYESSKTVEIWLKETHNLRKTRNISLKSVRNYKDDTHQYK